jgi:NAD(P)-dependent dehydrogenase (short-subunit alcohol dehydrogenase family)
LRDPVSLDLMRIARLLDNAMDRTVAPGFSRVGLAVRRLLPGWPADPATGALTGRSAMVTGASSGLGIATAEGLAALGAHVHLVVRNEAKGEAVLADLRGRHPEARLSVWRCDVSDLADVTRFTQEFLAADEGLDVLVHNAGAMPPSRAESAQGHEMTMSLHLLGPLAMTEQLLPALRDRDARVILVTSGGMYAQRLRDDDLEYLTGSYAGTTAYARSKRAQIELLPTLDQRWAPYGIRVYATHPGWADTPGVAESIPTFRRLTRPILRDAEGGADTTVWLAATTPAPTAGGLWHDRRQRPTHLRAGTRSTPDQVERLWAWTEEQAGPERTS